MNLIRPVVNKGNHLFCLFLKHIFQGASLVDKIKKTENIDRFETDVVDALDASNLHRYFRQDQTKILFGDVVDGKLVLGREGKF